MPRKKAIREDDFGTVKTNKDYKDEINGVLQRKINLTAKNESQGRLINSLRKNQITICSGHAGMGKTYVALAFALGMLKAQTNKFNKLYLIKSVTTLKGEEIGFLKGDLEQKFEPFMWSFILNMEKLVSDTSIKELFNKDIVRPYPLAYARGATLDDCIVICDEMQNITLDNARTLMTRIGFNCKMILLGDGNQIDLKNKDESSLNKLIEMFSDVDDFGCVKMDENDINVRNPIINVIEKKFKGYEKKK